jgi:hypothetical protein
LEGILGKVKAEMSNSETELASLAMEFKAFKINDHDRLVH